jgi:hypothetical protein
MEGKAHLPEIELRRLAGVVGHPVLRQSLDEQPKTQNNVKDPHRHVEPP